MLRQLLPIFVLLFILLVSCSEQKSSTIQTDVLKATFLKSSTVQNAETISFSTFSDTIFANQPTKHPADFLEPLLAKCKKIDAKKNYTVATKQYIKALLLAEYLYASCNSQFLGPQIGLAPQALSQTKFNRAGLHARLNAANHNEVAVWCADRAQLYKQLAKQLFNLPIRIINNTPTHVFSLVQIANKWYIIDPFDPFLLLAKGQTELLDYESLKHSKRLQQQQIVALRTKHSFGNTAELISQRFYDFLQKSDPIQKQAIAVLLLNYLRVNKDQLFAQADCCTYENAYKLYEIYPVKSSQNAFLLRSSVPGALPRKRLLKMYFGISCTKD